MTLPAGGRTEFAPSPVRPARTPRSQTRPRHIAARAPEGPLIHAPTQVGKYLVSPLTRLDDSGRHHASVSIRSGRGRATHDRVMRFSAHFDTAADAARFALEQGIAWIDAAAQPIATSSQEHATWPRKN